MSSSSARNSPPPGPGGRPIWVDVQQSGSDVSVESPEVRVNGVFPPAVPGNARFDSVDSVGGEVSPFKPCSETKPGKREDPDVLYYGDELRLYAQSEYASAAAAAASSALRHTGGYVGVYFKGRRRKSRTGQQPLACLPPMGDKADGEISESLFRCVDPNGAKTAREPVKIGDEVLLVDADGHVWNTSTAGVVEYLTMRLRGERGEMRVRFTRDLAVGSSRRSSQPTSTELSGPDEDGSPRSSPRLARPKSMGRLRTSPRSTDKLVDYDRPSVRYGDALWLVSCPQHDHTHPGAQRSMRREHVLTNYKRDTSSLLGGYVTVDPRGYALQFIVRRAAPYIDKVCLGRAVWYSLPFRRPVAFELSAADAPTLTLETSLGATATLADVGATDRKFWLELSHASGQADEAMGCVLLELANCAPLADDSPADDDAPAHKGGLSSSSSPYETLALAVCVAAAARLFIRDAAAQRAVAVVPTAIALFGSSSSRRTGPLLVSACALVVAVLGERAGWTVAFALTAVLVKSLRRDEPSDARNRGLAGELAVLDWSPTADCLERPRDGDVVQSPFKEVSPVEMAAVEELRNLVRDDAFAPRWIEDGELLRFVRARKTVQQRLELFKEAMAWRKSRASGDGVYADSVKEDPFLGSFGKLERKWCAGAPAPLWWDFLSAHLPFQIYGADRSGLPITYLGLGRMDLSSISREVGVDRLEQKIIMQNDMFLDLAREARAANRLLALHGGVFIIDLDGMSRRALKEINIFKRVSAALKVLHPERQRKTFLVRAPRVFHFVWKLIKPMLDQRILSKIIPLDNLKPLFDELGAHNVPTELGGTFQFACDNHSAASLDPGAFADFCAARCTKH